MKNIKTYKLFENKDSSLKEELNNISDEFWEMIKIVDWDKVIKEKQNWNRDINNDIEYKAAEIRLYKNFEYDEIKKLNYEYYVFYSKLYDYLESYWLDEPGYSVSDDGYSDLISSIIGKGKEFILSVIDNTNIPAKMASEKGYAENFGYLLNIDDDVKNKLHNIYFDLK